MRPARRGVGEGDGDGPAVAAAVPLPGRADHRAADRRGAVGGVLAARGAAPGRQPGGPGPADGQLRPGQRGRPPGLRDLGAAGTPGLAGRRGRRPGPGRHQLAAGRDHRARQGQPPRQPAVARRRGRGSGRLAGRGPPAGGCLPGGVRAAAAAAWPARLHQRVVCRPPGLRPGRRSPRPGRTGCGTPQRPACWRPAGRWPRSGRFSGTPSPARPRSTPRPTCSRCRRWHGRGRGDRDEPPQQSHRGLPGDAARPGLQAGEGGPAAAGFRRLRRSRRGQHGHHRSGGRVVDHAPERKPGVGSAAAEHGARLRPLPASRRPGSPGPARRAAAGPDPPGHALHLLRRRSRRADDRGPDAAQPAEGSDLRDPDRTARGDRHAG